MDLYNKHLNENWGCGADGAGGCGREGQVIGKEG
jgi:hypothetical protein